MSWWDVECDPIRLRSGSKIYDDGGPLNYPLATLRILPLGNWFEVLVPGVHPGYGPTTSRLVSPRHPDFAAVKAEYARQTKPERPQRLNSFVELD